MQKHFRPILLLNKISWRVIMLGGFLIGALGYNYPTTAASIEARGSVTRRSSVSSGILVDDFEGTNPLSSWILEAIGTATGSSALGDGYTGQGAHIIYDIPTSGAVSFRRDLSTSIDADALSIWVKAPSRIRMRVCIFDTFGGEYCQIPVRPFSAVDSKDWFHLLVRFNALTTVNQIKITVELENGIITYASGEVILDDIFLVQGGYTYVIDPQNMLVTPALAYPARTFHDILGIDRNWAEGNDPQAIPILNSIGTKYARIGAEWHGLETSLDSYDFSTLDALIATHEAGGITPILIIGSGSYYHTGEWNKTPITSSELTAFGNYVRAVAQRYAGHGFLYDIWSEPTNPVWDPPQTGTQFAAIVQTARQQIQAVDPSAIVITGGLLNYDPEFVHEFLAAGGVNGVNGFGVHSYNTRMPEVLGESFLMIRSEFEKLDIKPLPFWDTEWGFSAMSLTVDPGDVNNARMRQAQDVAREFLSGWGNGLNSVVYWHFRDTNQDPTAFDNFGLVDYNYNDKLAMQAVRVLSEIGSERTMTGWLNDLPADCYGFQMDGSKNVVLAIWCNSFPLDIQVPNSSVAIDFLGNPISTTSQGAYSLVTIDKQDWPIYITCYECPQLQYFADVPITHWAWNWINRLYDSGITGGCSTALLSYCPDNPVTRAQMAVFLERGMNYPASFNPPNVAPTFNDTVGHWAEDWIEALKSDGITAGCAAGLYCPEAVVTRAQMAVFLLKAKHGSSYTPPMATGVFTDVPTFYWAAPWIEQLAKEGITSGCGATTYCPENPVTRAQMAVFLVKTFNLP